MACKKLLRKTATKNTAVACHWIRGRRRSELLWIVGNRSKFNVEGAVPANRTQKSLSQNNWENDWHYSPLIKALVALSSLLHDWGKCNQLFQQKLTNNSYKGDPLRHEWLSCLLLKSLVEISGDTENDISWLSLLSSNKLDEDIIKSTIQQKSNQTDTLNNLPPLA